MNALTASDVAAVLGFCPYANKTSVFNKKTRPPKTETGGYIGYGTAHGTKYEQEACRKFAMEYNKTVFEHGLILHPEYKWLGASPDGLCHTGEMVEIKCPVTREILREKDYPCGCPVQYYPQVQCQLQCADLYVCYFVQYKPETAFQDMEFLVTKVYRDNSWWDKYFPMMKEFWDSVLKYRFERPDWHEVAPPPEPAKKRRKILASMEDEELPVCDIDSILSAYK
jgi:putative phage-type endonuclease